MSLVLSRLPLDLMVKSAKYFRSFIGKSDSYLDGFFDVGSIWYRCCFLGCSAIGAGFYFFESIPVHKFIRKFICAPLISVLLFCVAGIVLPPLGNVGAYVVIGLSLGVSLVAWGVALLCRGDRDEGFLGKTSVSHSVYGFSAIVSVLVLGLTFVVSLNGPDSFSQHSDNMAHLGKIKAMIESGYFSTLSTSSYNAVFDSSQIPFEGVGFYPSAWHVVCALVGSVLDCSPGLTENAVNFVLAALVLPCAMCLLGDRVSRGDKRFSLACGAFSCIFAAFPIGLYLFGPLYPNAASYCCLPILLVIFLDFLRGLKKRKDGFRI